jgi:hypothetical protein
MKVVALVTGCCGLLACGRPEVPVPIDATFTADERAAIASAIEDWNQRTNDRHKIESRTWPWFIVRQDPGSARAGKCVFGAALILLRPGMSPDMLRAAARHELGHALGLQHVRRGVMQPDTFAENDFSEEDVAECRRAGAC